MNKEEILALFNERFGTIVALPNINVVTYKYSTLGGRAYLKLDF